MTFVAVTTTAVVGGTVFLMGTSAPVDEVTVDGEAVPAKVVMALLTDLPELGAEYSVIVSLPPEVASGSHQLRVSRGDEVWNTDLTVVTSPAPRRAERGASCGRQAMDRPLRAYIAGVNWVDVVRDGRLDPVSFQPAGVGLVVLDGVRLFVVPDRYSFFVPIADRPPSSRLVQAIYPDGTVGDRWSIDCEAQPLSESSFGAKLPGGAVPLWVSRDPKPDSAPSKTSGAGPPVR